MQVPEIGRSGYKVRIRTDINHHFLLLPSYKNKTKTAFSSTDRSEAAGLEPAVTNLNNCCCCLISARFLTAVIREDTSLRFPDTMRSTPKNVREI